MGRWVTSKGRRIYIPDEGEENPFTKNDIGPERRRAKETTQNAEARDKYRKDYNALSENEKKEIDRQLLKNHPDWYPNSNKKDKDYDIRKSEHGVFVAHSSAEGKKKGVKDLEKRFDNEKEAKAWIKSQKKTDKEVSKIRLVSKEEMDEKIKQAQIKENKKQADTRNGKKDTWHSETPDERKEFLRRKEVAHSLGLRNDVLGQLATDRYTPEGLKDAVERGWITQKQADKINGKTDKKTPAQKFVEKVPKKKESGKSLVSKSFGSLKTMYKNASTEEERKRILAELNSRGFYNKNGRWTSKGGGR